MARAVAPMPIQTPLLVASGLLPKLGRTWERWFKTVSDFAQDAGNISTGSGLNCAIVGCVVIIEYVGTGGAYTLPHNPIRTPWFDLFDGTAWTKIAAIKGANDRWTITIPAGSAMTLRGQYLTDIST